MTSTVDQLPRLSSRLVKAAPVGSLQAFQGSLEKLTGRQLLTDGMQGFAGRNDNWLVPTTEGPDLFVKRLRGDRAHVEQRMARITAFEALIAGSPPCEYRTPPYHGVDREQALLVFDYLPRTRAASELLEADEFGTGMAHRFGRILAEIHRLPTAATGVDDAPDADAATAFYALTADGYANCSGGEVEAWAMLQHDKVLVQGLADLREMSRSAPPVASHSDVRLDQFLVAGTGVYVIDWEEFRYTDPARDLGGLVGELLHTAAHRMFSDLDVPADLAPGAAHDVILRQGEREVAVLREHIQELWRGYRGAIEVDEGLAVRATAYAGWHFFDRLLAGAVHGAKLSAAQRGMAGIGRNALTAPERYAATIGLDRN